MTKEENHKKAPICAEFVQKMREAFGDDQVRVLWVREGAFAKGKKEEE